MNFEILSKVFFHQTTTTRRRSEKTTRADVDGNKHANDMCFPYLVMKFLSSNDENLYLSFEKIIKLIYDLVMANITLSRQVLSDQLMMFSVAARQAFRLTRNIFLIKLAYYVYQHIFIVTACSHFPLHGRTFSIDEES